MSENGPYVEPRGDSPLMPAIVNQIYSNIAGPVDRAGECGVLMGSGIREILRLLGSGEPLGNAICQSMGTCLASDFGLVRIHAGGEAARIAERIGAEAFSIGRHIVFARGRFNPQSENGERLLRHELAHIAQEKAREDRLCCWFTLNNSGHRIHGLRSSSEAPVLGPDRRPEPPETNVGVEPNATHEDLATQALVYVGGFGPRARSHLMDWVAKIDKFKGPEWPSVLSDHAFPQLRHFSERLVHAWRGTPASDIGMTSADLVFARCSTGGVVGTLLHDAVDHFNRGYKEHALKLLGISLHTIEDFYSHSVDIYDSRYHPSLELRQYAASSRPPVTVYVMEDDPKIAPTRWRTAKERSIEQLKTFKTRVSAADLAAF